MSAGSIPGYGNLINRVMESYRQPEPKVGDAATITMWSDRHPATVIEAGPRRCVVQEDAWVRTDRNGISESQTYEYTRNPGGQTYEFTLRRNGRWVHKGDSMRRPSFALIIGRREKYEDPSF